MSSTPQIWRTAQEAQKRFFSRVADAPGSLLISDYDGTLAPFQKDKMQAFPYVGLQERLLQMLALPRIRLVFVTGRPATELRELLSVADHVEIWGAHGWDHIDAAGNYFAFSLTAEQKEILEKIQSVLVERGYEGALERKPASLAVHWRGAAQEEQQRLEGLTRVLASQYASAASFETMPFEAGIEIRCTGRTKADAVRNILEEGPSGTVAAYLGDDRTDEDAFPVVKKNGIAILVRPEVRESQADFWMCPPGDVINFFDHWIDSARSRA